MSDNHLPLLPVTLSRTMRFDQVAARQTRAFRSCSTARPQRARASPIQAHPPPADKQKQPRFLTQSRTMDSALPHDPNDDLGHYLQRMVAHGASDLFLSSGSSAALKVQGVVRRLPEGALDAAHTQRLAYSVMREAQIREFESTLECDLAIALPGLGRFRVNVYRQRGDVAVVVRHINAKIPSLEQLKLPPVLRKLALLKRGLVLVVGAAGSGKWTTLGRCWTTATTIRPGTS